MNQVLGIYSGIFKSHFFQNIIIKAYIFNIPELLKTSLLLHPYNQLALVY